MLKLASDRSDRIAAINESAKACRVTVVRYFPDGVRHVAYEPFANKTGWFAFIPGRLPLYVVAYAENLVDLSKWARKNGLEH